MSQSNIVSNVAKQRCRLYLDTNSKDYRTGQKPIPAATKIKDIIIKFRDSDERFSLAEIGHADGFDAIVVRTGYSGNHEDWIESKWLEIFYEKGDDEYGWHIVAKSERYPIDRIWIVDVQYETTQNKEKSGA